MAEDFDIAWPIAHPGFLFGLVLLGWASGQRSRLFETSEAKRPLAAKGK